MTYRPSPITGFFLASALGLLHSSAALAQEAKPDAPKQEAAKPDAPKSENQVKASALFSEARKLVDAGDYKQACPKFEQSLSLNVGIGVQFNLADCWEHVGRTASAHLLFEGVAASARALGQNARADIAQARADALEPRLVRMQIDVRGTDPNLVVRRNQIAVAQKSWGIATPIDAGEYVVDASAPGKKPWSARVIVPVMTSEVVAVTIPVLAVDDAAPVVGPAPTPVLEKAEKPAPTPLLPPEPTVDPKDHRRNLYAYSLAGLGVVSVGLGTVMALEFKSKNDDAKAICPSGTGCARADVDHHAQLVSDAKNFRTWSFVGFGVGSAALVAGAVLYFAPSHAAQASGINAAPFVTADGSWGAVASGRF